MSSTPVWYGVVSLVVPAGTGLCGYLLSGRNEEARDRRATEREPAARQLERDVTRDVWGGRERGEATAHQAGTPTTPQLTTATSRHQPPPTATNRHQPPPTATNRHHHHHVDAGGTRTGLMPLAERWSLQAGGRHLGAVTQAPSSNGDPFSRGCDFYT